MTEVSTLLQTKRTPIRVHKPLPKPMKWVSPTKDTTITNLSESQPFRKSYSPSRIRQSKLKQDAKLQFNVCASKDVFVFSRKQQSFKLKKKAKPKQNKTEDASQKIFCGRDRVKRSLYRTIIRGESFRSGKSQDLSQRKMPTSETNITLFNFNPEPWQINGEGHELETLL